MKSSELFLEFRLIYEGPLKSNRGPSDKQRIRRAIHPQLKELLSRPPMQPLKQLIDARDERVITRQINGFTFVPLITEKLRHVVELEVILLTPEEPGRAITQGGDLDNRMKTLLDALRMPIVSNELPSSDTPESSESPFFCLVENDSLISGLSVFADRLLRPVKEKSDVVVIMRVVARPTYTSLAETHWT